MKKWPLLLVVYFCSCLLVACGTAGSGETVPGGVPSNEEPSGGESTQPASVTAICRVVSNDGSLLLAGMDGDPNIYTLTPEDDTNLAAGALVEVTYDGTVLESWPAQFSGVTAVNTARGGFDDRCALYLQVLEDLWEVDSGLNDGVTYIGVDLSATSLTDSERAAVAWAFAGKHGGELVTGTFDELAEQDYFTASPISTPAPEEGEPIPRAWYQWEDGILFSITEKEIEGVYSLTPVTFDAEKWRSGLGAYFFCDCTSVQTAGGHWDGYTVGSQAIS